MCSKSMLSSQYILPSHSPIKASHWLVVALLAVGIHILLLFGYPSSPEKDQGAKDVGSQGIYVGLKKIVEASTPIQKKVEAPKPVVEPKPVKKTETKVKPKPVVKKAKPKPKPVVTPVPAVAVKTEAASEVSEAVKVTNRRSDVQTSASAEKSSYGGGNPAVRVSYESKLLARLERNKRYPNAARRRGQEGTVTIRFTISQSGKLLSHKIIKPSKHERLNKAAEKMLKKSSPFPPVPDEILNGQSQYTVTVPVGFNLR